MPRSPRRIAALAAAILALLACAPIALPADHLARAADRGLVVIADTSYLALPEERRVHVTIDAVATSYTPNPIDGLAYYPAVEFAAQRGATAFSASAGGQVVLGSGEIADPFSFFAYLSADRPGAFSDTMLNLEVDGEPAPIRVRAWQDDPDWGTAMSTLLTDGLPALQELIGLPYEAPGMLIVEEAAASRLGEYAGIYNRLTGIIRVRYDADAFVGLHEAAHLWFNNDLFRDRWIGEAWAEFYGVQAAKAIGATGEEFDLTDEMLVNQMALNDWGGIGGVEIGVEAYAYAASYHLALLIFARTDVAELQSVWRGVTDGEMAYQPVNGGGPPRTGVDVSLDGWQQLLDMLDERTGSQFDDLWLEWVVSDRQRSAMDDRAVARDHYADVVLQAGDWNLPTNLRHAMGSWQFDLAELNLGLADEVLSARDEIASDAADLALTPPAALQEAFEGDGGLSAAKEEGNEELQVLAGIAAATDRLDDEVSLFETIGLLGADPDATLDSARTAFEADQLDAARQAAAEALAARQGAGSAGQTRAAIGGGGLVVLSGGIVVVTRIRRRRRSATGSPAAEEPSDAPR